MHPTLLTQLLGKVGEAWLTHAEANNLPNFVGASCAELVHAYGKLRAKRKVLQKKYVHNSC